MGKSRFGASEGEASELDLGESLPSASPLCSWVGSGWAALERAQAGRMGGGAGNLDASLSLSSDFVCLLRWVLLSSTFLVLVEEARRVRSLRAPEKGREREWTKRSPAGAGPGRRRVLIYSRCRGLAAQRGDCSSSQTPSESQRVSLSRPRRPRAPPAAATGECGEPSERRADAQRFPTLRASVPPTLVPRLYSHCSPSRGSAYPGVPLRVRVQAVPRPLSPREERRRRARLAGDLGAAALSCSNPLGPPSCSSASSPDFSFPCRAAV